MVIVGEVVLACTAGVDGTILVYDRNLQHMREIQHNGGGEFWEISADSQHNLYVADYYNNSIHFFSIDGTHLHSFNTNTEDNDDGGGDDEDAPGPNSVHVFQQHAYITNFSHDISVFTTDGTHVITFGSSGSEVGQLCGPYSITVGEDGLVYVAEYNNNRIQCF